MLLNQQAGRELYKARQRLADHLAEKLVEESTTAMEKWGLSVYELRDETLQDIAKLYIALITERPEYFGEHIAWRGSTLVNRDKPVAILTILLNTLKDVLHTELPEELHPLLHEYLEYGVEQAKKFQEDSASTALDPGGPYAQTARMYLDHLLRGEKDEAEDLILSTLEEGVDVRDLYLHVFQPILYETGRLWQTNRISVGHEHFCTATTKGLMEQLRRYRELVEKNGKTVVATCLGGELHEMGIRIVTDFFEMSGWKSYYLGPNTPMEGILQAIKHQKADLLAISVTMSIYLGATRDIIHLIKGANGLQIPVMVGGIVFNEQPELVNLVGADVTARDAAGAVAEAEELV